jgi:hypothetical protein
MVTAPTTDRLVVVAVAAPCDARSVKSIVVTAALPMAVASCCTALSEPLVARVVLHAEAPHADDQDERGFELGLDCILDGLAANLPPA